MFAYLLYRMLLRLTTIDTALINASFYVVGLNIISVKAYLTFVF